MHKEEIPYKIVFGLEGREMTEDETINYTKSKVVNFNVDHLHSMDEIKEHLHMIKQLRGEEPFPKYFIGPQRLYAHHFADLVVTHNNINKVLQLTDDELFSRVAYEYIDFKRFNSVFKNYRGNNSLDHHERYYLKEGIKIAKDLLDFKTVDSIIEKYNWANLTGGELYDIVIRAQKKLLKKWTKYTEELVSAGARILLSEYGVYFHHTDGVTLQEYIDSAKQFRRENWDFDLE